MNVWKAREKAIRMLMDLGYSYSEAIALVDSIPRPPARVDLPVYLL